MGNRLALWVGSGIFAASLSGALFLGTPSAAAAPDAGSSASAPSSAAETSTASSTRHDRRSERSRARTAKRAERATASRHVAATTTAEDADASPTPRRKHTRAATLRDTTRADDATPSADAVPAARSSQRRPTLLNVVGSAALNVLGGFIHLVDGAPKVPAGSTVTVHTSSLTLPIGSGRNVQADWYFPEDADTTTRLVYLQHGFLASGPMYSRTASNLAERTDSIVVAPSLSSNFFAADAAWVGGSTMHRAVADLFVGDRQELTESASAAAGYAVVLPQKFVLVGHSAGGALVTSAAGFMADNGAIDDLVGIVMLDGVEPAGSRLVGQALAKLTGADDRPIYLISSERYFWCRGGDMADKLTLARPDRFTGVGLADGRHIDYMEGNNPLIQLGEYLVAGFSRPQNTDAAGILTAGWVNDLFAGTTTEGVYGTPEQVIPIVTPAGTATAVVLPLGEPARPVWPPLLDTVLTAIFDFAGKYLFVYEPLRGVDVAPRRESLLAA